MLISYFIAKFWCDSVRYALADVKGIEWIRLHYAYPSKFPLEILDVMRERSNICKTSSFK